MAEKLSNECIEMANGLGPKPTFEDFMKAFELMSRLRFPWMACFPIGDGGEEFVNRYAVEHSIAVDKVGEMIPQLSNSLTDDQKELSRFKAQIEKEKLPFDIVRIGEVNPALAKKIKDYQKKTEYIGTHHFWGDERSIDRLMDAIKNSSLESKDEKIANSKIRAFEIIAEATKWRLECAQSSAFLAYMFRPFMTELAERHGITYDDLIFLLTSEIKDLVENKKEVLPLTRERQKAMAILKIDGNISIVVGEELHQLEKHFGLLDEHEAVEEFRGAIGNKGIVRGTVVIVFKPTDQAKVKPGMILVAPETTPDFIPSMGKAAAFVTDQGGITSHAAIVAREMNKPCITGTKIATKVLKDGDVVEVDADSGIVRILKNENANPTRIGGKDWKLVVTRNMSHWHNMLSLRGHANTKDFGIDVPCLWLYVTIDGTRTSVFMEPENLAVYSKAVMEAFSTKEKVADMKKKYHERVSAALKAFKEADKDLNFKTWSKFLESYQRLTPGLMITTNFGRGGTEKIIELLKQKGIEENEIHQIISTVTYPVEHTPLFDSQIALMEIGSKIQKGSLKEQNIEVELSKWLEEYGCIPVNFCEEPWNMQDAKLQLESVMKKDCKKELSKAVEDHEQKASEKKAIFKKINDPELEIIASALAEATYLNEFRKNAFCRISLGYRGMFTKIAAMGGSQNWRDIFYLTPEETTALLAGEKVDISKLVSERRLAGAYVNDEGKEIFLDQNTLNNLEAFIRATYTAPKASSDGVDFVKGFSANRGKVQGIARVILSSKDFGKLNPNEILVTTMTSVDFVPVMERAAAFVTNEGGITSHAAIVAREMNKPCVIGTKNATQIIKDGDMVEVDANNGIVRVLESSKTPNPSDYIRMFSAGAFMYIFSDIFLQHYNSFGVLSVQDEKTWMSFFPKVSQTQTQKDGKQLYESAELYQKYRTEFDEYIRSSSEYFASILKKDILEVDEVEKFLNLAARHFYFYSKTEFFYTDLIDPKKMAISVEEFDKLKLSGRSYLNKILFEGEGYIRSLIRKISTQTGALELDLLNYSVAEVILLVKSGERVSEQTISDRHVYFDSQDLKLFGEKSKELTNKFLSLYREISNTIKGVTAYKGKVTGRAFVFPIDFKNFHKMSEAVHEMKEGEILVAETTAPEIIQACKKASAIITNQGGMLSHAAIVSRELRIPCIVGTDKDVILNIKTGDDLEVDADSGLIKIIS